MLTSRATTPEVAHAHEKLSDRELQTLVKSALGESAHQ